MRHLVRSLSRKAGCLTLLLVLAGCTSSADRALDAQAQAAKMGAKTASLQAYSDYVLGVQKLNTDRQTKNLPPLPVLTYENWIAQATSK